MAAGRGVALVTGGSRRIGRVVALACARSGRDVALHARRDDAEARATLAEVEATGVRAALLTGDLGEPDVAAGLVGRAAAALGPVTLAVASASLYGRDAAADFTAAEFDRHMAVNLRAPLLMAQALARQGEAACFVAIVDQRVLNLTPEDFTYTLSKAALRDAVRMMAQAFAPRLRVNGVAPGPTLANTHDGEEGFAREIAALPLRAGPTPEEIAAAVLYLAEARSVTGQMIAVDGGQHLAR